MSPPSFLVDECLPFEVTHELRARGFDATDLFERGVRGLPDEGVWKLAAGEGRILVTRDLDFPLRGVEPRPAGLVLLRAADDATAAALAALLHALLEATSIESLLGCITVVSPGRYRQRKW